MVLGFSQGSILVVTSLGTSSTTQFYCEIKLVTIITTVSVPVILDLITSCYKDSIV